jgi:hypothetical protein
MEDAQQLEEHQTQRLSLVERLAHKIQVNRWTTICNGDRKTIHSSLCPDSGGSYDEEFLVSAIRSAWSNFFPVAETRRKSL